MNRKLRDKAKRIYRLITFDRRRWHGCCSFDDRKDAHWFTAPDMDGELMRIHISSVTSIDLDCMDARTHTVCAPALARCDEWWHHHYHYLKYSVSLHTWNIVNRLGCVCVWAWQFGAPVIIRHFIVISLSLAFIIAISFWQNVVDYTLSPQNAKYSYTHSAIRLFELS